MEASLQKILTACGLAAERCEAVHGGDINDACCIYADGRKYFLKTNNASLYPGMFAKEQDGLLALKNNHALSVPAAIANGIETDNQFLLLEWIEKGLPAKNFWEDFGRGLAQLHFQQQPFFGWKEDNYIGSLKQVNTKKNQWDSFYAECRILPLVKILFENGSFSATEGKAADKLCIKLNEWFPGEYPSLLHGDLWAGNFMTGANGKAVIYDPAVYYGHREMDIGMSLLFGGFDQRFYAAYNEAFPMQPGWQQRIQLTQLYPLLVHAVLFGGHYINSAVEIIKRF